MDSGATKAQPRAPFEMSSFGSGTYQVTETKTGRAVFYGPKSVAEKWLKELSGAYVRGVEHAIGTIQDADQHRFERGEVLNGRNPRSDARLLRDLNQPLASLGQGDFRHDVRPRDVIGGGR